MYFRCTYRVVLTGAHKTSAIDPRAGGVECVHTQARRNNFALLLTFSASFYLTTVATSVSAGVSRGVTNVLWYVFSFSSASAKVRGTSSRGISPRLPSFSAASIVPLPLSSVRLPGRNMVYRLRTERSGDGTESFDARAVFGQQQHPLSRVGHEGRPILAERHLFTDFILISRGEISQPPVIRHKLSRAARAPQGSGSLRPGSRTSCGKCSRFRAHRRKYGQHLRGGSHPASRASRPLLWCPCHQPRSGCQDG